MKKWKIRTQLACGFACIVCAVIFLISISANVLIRKQFASYIESEQERFSSELAENLSEQYHSGNNTWNLEYIHGVGMYAVNDGYFLKLYDDMHNLLWDIEHHEMQCCAEMMNEISQKMEKLKMKHADFVSHEYPLYQNQNLIGYAEIVYTPYYMNENAFQFLDALNLILFIIGFLSLIGAVIAGFLFAQRISKPVSEIIARTRQIADGQYENKPVSDTSSAEMAELTESVSFMADTLRNQEKLRKQLTSDVAHELRTPLTNVASHLEMMTEGIWQPTENRLESCYEEIRRISSLVDDLEKLHQLEEEQLILHKQVFPLCPVLQTAVKAFEKELEDKNIHCLLSCEEVSVCADKDRIMQIVTNLLSNAVKYSEKDGEISVSARNTERGVLLQVCDNGIGIPEEDIPHIFERFYRADKSRNRSTGGAGIGLAVVKGIADAHHNITIEVESRSGTGTVFSVYFLSDSGKTG